MTGLPFRALVRLLALPCIGGSLACGATEQAANPGNGVVVDAAADADGDAGGSNGDVDAPSDELLLRVTRGGGLGFCIKNDQFTLAELRYTAGNAELVLSGAVFRACSSDATPCELVSDHVKPIVPFALSEARRAEVEAYVEKLPTTECLPQLSPVCDYCFDTQARAKGLGYRDNICVTRCRTDLAAIGSFIDRLAPPFFGSPNTR